LGLQADTICLGPQLRSCVRGQHRKEDMSKKALATTNAPGAIGPYSQGVAAGDLVFSSGQLPATPNGELVVDDITKATEHCLSNVFAILKEAGAGPEHVVKVTVFLTDMADFGAVNAVYEKAFEAPYPARSCIEVSGLPKGAPIEIEAIARLP